MWLYVARRFVFSIPVLAATSFIVFACVSSTSDPLGQIRMQPKITPAQVERLAHEKHLDEPVVIRYGYWVEDAFLHKFGDHLLSGSPIWPDLKRVLGHTLQLVLVAEALAILLAILIGVYSAVRQYSKFDYAATTFSFLGFATPVFWLALILQVIFTDIYLKWDVRIFYTAQLSSPNPDNWFVDRVQHLALPIVTLAVLQVANYSRFLRASMLEVLNSDFARTARGKGLREIRVVMKHVFRNALIPLVTVIAVNFGGLLGGAVVTETVFTLDGMGFFFINALNAGDPYPIMAWLAIVATMTVLANLVADVALGWLDPRVRLN
jgi:peptide/nickel transport system permease protein